MRTKLKPKKSNTIGSNELIRHAVHGIEDKKGSEIIYVNLKKIPNSVCDYFLICEGNSRTHVQAIAQSVEDFIEKNTGVRPWHVEGLTNAEWVLVDYVDVVVHIFQPEARIHYNLENLWADADSNQISTQTLKLKTMAKKTTKKTTKKATKKVAKKVTKKSPIKKKAKRK